MEYIYAALLLHAGKKEVTEENVKKVVEAAGLAVEDAKVKALVSSIKDVNIEEAIKSASVPVAAAPVAAPAGAAEKPKEEKKDEKKSEEEAAAGLASLFG